jgi:hypothetical protein
MKKKNTLIYGHPDNSDISKRPSNRTLVTAVVFGFFLSALPGAALLPFLYVLISGEPTAFWTVTAAIVGALIGMSMYFPSNLRSGRIKKREFIAAGGDPTGITDHMFGAMSGRKLRDGSWEWSPEGGSGDSW